MVKFREYKQINYPEVGKEIRAFWKNNNIFSKTITERSGGPSFTFFEGPPSANGTPGIHHVMARAVKDIFCRYKTQKGFQVKRKGGWDTHGLPVELQVEKELGITKDDIGKKISIADYNKKCKEKTIETYKTREGVELALPVYYRNKIYNEDERESLWLEKLDKEERYVCGVKVDISQGEDEYYKLLEMMRQKNKRLGYGDDAKNWELKKYENERRNLKKLERLQKLYGVGQEKVA